MTIVSNRLDKLKSALIAVAVTLLALLIAIIVKKNATVPLEEAKRLNTSGTTDVQVVGDCIYYKEGSSLRCVESDGDLKWNLSVDYNSKFRADKNGVAVWNYRKFQIIDADTGISKISSSLDKDILSARIGNSYAAIALSPEDNSEIVITDLQGNEVDRITGLNELTVVEYGFFENQNLFWLMTLDSTGSLPTCTVATYKPGRSITGNITDMEQVIYKVQFRQNYIYAVGTSYMRVYDYKGTELTNMRKTVYGYTLEAVNDDTENPLMVFIPNSETNTEFNIQDMRVLLGNSEYRLHFPVSCMALAAKGSTVYGFTGSALCMAKPLEGVSTRQYKLPVVIDGLIGVTDDLTAVCSFGNTIYLIKLPE